VGGVVPSLVEALRVRQDRARARLVGLREQMEALAGQVAVVEAELSRLEITRETVDEVLADGSITAAAVAAGVGGVQAEAVALRGRVPVMLAAQESGDATVLSEPYRRILVVFAQAGGPLRCKAVCEGVGAGTTANQVEAMRSKLKRLAERGILAESEPGLFALAAGLAQ
jgi:hypothetical protein